MKPSEVFNRYRAIKQHFTSSYDYFKYNGKMRWVDLNKRNDSGVFTRLAHKLQDKDVEAFFVAHMLENPTQWVGDMMHDEIFPAYKKKMLRFTTIFRSDLKTVMEFAEQHDMTLEDVFKVQDAKYPVIVKLMQQGFITFETYIVLNRIMKLQSHYDQHYSDDIMMEDLTRRVANYSPFLDLPITTFAQIAENTLGE